MNMSWITVLKRFLFGAQLSVSLRVELAALLTVPFNFFFIIIVLLTLKDQDLFTLQS